MIEFKTALKQKQSFGLSMGLWFPILQSDILDLEKTLSSLCGDNPCIEIASSKYLQKTYEVTKQKSYNYDSYDYHAGVTSSMIENLNMQEESLYDKLFKQIEAPLFPTPKSQNIAFEIIHNLNEQGFFTEEEACLAHELECSPQEVENVRKRFCYLEPAGIGAKDIKEAFLFQLENVELSNQTYLLLQKMIEKLEHLDTFTHEENFHEAKEVLKKFNRIPAIDYYEQEQHVVADLSVEIGQDTIEIKINNRYYPDVHLNKSHENENFLKEKFKEAKQVLSMLSLRKATLYQVALSIVQKQYRFFVGGDLIPLRMQDIAQELGYNESTISRAVTNKYLECERGVFELKEFFSNEVSNNVSSSEIKTFIQNLIESEDKSAPLSDLLILEAIQKRFHINMVRRSITKYRQELFIASSKERKKIYKILQA